MDPFDRMVCDAFEDLAQIVLWIEHIQLCRFGQREDRCCPFASGIRTGVEPILSSERHHPFILPMSDKSWKSNTVGIPISGAKSWFVG